MNTLAMILSVLLLATTAFAQAHRAIVLGQVRDASAAAVPNADIKVIHTETNATYATRTNEAGNYEVPGVLPGTYRVEASVKGFKTAAVDKVVVTSGRRAQVDLTLAIGEVTEAVTVTSERQLLDTASADVNNIVDQRKVADLPVGQGNVTYFFFFASGADSASAASRGTSVGNDVQPMQRAGTGQSRFNGSPQGTAEFTIDGAPNTQRGNGVAGGAVAFNPGPDMVQEVRVQTATFDASVGHSGGATIDMVLKSGTNQYHGTGSMFFRNKEWNANTWAGNRGGLPRTDFEFKLWSLSFGGPVNIPKLYRGKDRTFFFIGYERWASLSPNPPGFVTIPRPQHLRGDLSDLLRLGPQYQFYDPDSGVAAAGGRIQRTPFANNIIPASRLNPVTQIYAKLFPEPNTQGTAEGLQNFTYVNEPLPRRLWALPIRIDHNLSNSQKLFGRVVWNDTALPRSGVFTRTDISFWSIQSNHREAAVGDVWTINPGFIADFRASLMRFPWNTYPIGSEVDYKAFGFENIAKLLDTKLVGMPGVTIAGPYTAFSPVQGSQLLSEIRTAQANFTKVHRNHSLKFGTDLRWYIDNRGRNDLFTVAFGGAYSRGPLDNSPAPPIGNGLVDFLTGRFASATISQPSKAANLSTFQGIYFQDDWKLTPRLTLSLGVRYEREGPATERFNRNLAGFDFNVENPIAAAARANYATGPIAEIPASQFGVRGGLQFAGISGNPRTIYDANNRNFAPRVGIAWQARQDTVLRAGYGIYYLPYGQRFIANEGGVPGFDINTQSFSTEDGIRFTRTLDNLFPSGLDAPVGSSQGLRTFLGQGLTVPALRRNPNAYNQRWQFGVQQRFGAYRMEVRYVGNRTLKMPIQRNANSLDNVYLSRSPERDQARIDYLSSRVNNPFFRIPGVTGTIGTQQFSTPGDLLRPYPEFAAINIQNPQGFTSYHALQFELERRLARGITFQTGYTFQKTIDGLSYLNPADPMPEKVIADFDRPHIWRFIALWEVPLARGNKWLGGWQLQSLAFGQSGYPIPFGNILFRGNIKDIGTGPKLEDRLFNTDAGFEKAVARQLASNVRTFPSRLAGVRTDRAWNTDLSLIKNTKVREQVTAQFRAEAYNVFNQHFIQGAINTDPTNRAFGSSVAATGPRTLQLGVKLVF